MKAVLVIDMQTSCSECPFLDENYDYPCCIARNHLHGGYNFPINEKRQSFCPIKPLPQKKEITEVKGTITSYRYENAEYMVETTNFGFNEGWNACLNEILGNEE